MKKGRPQGRPFCLMRSALLWNGDCHQRPRPTANDQLPTTDYQNSINEKEDGPFGPSSFCEVWLLRECQWAAARRLPDGTCTIISADSMLPQLVVRRAQ
jgi:hypothetical protein